MLRISSADAHHTRTYLRRTSMQTHGAPHIMAVVDFSLLALLDRS